MFTVPFFLAQPEWAFVSVTCSALSIYQCDCDYQHLLICCVRKAAELLLQLCCKAVD